MPSMPPSPLGTRFLWEIDREILSRMVNSLYSHYDALGFGKLSWAYWHAVSATLHIAIRAVCEKALIVEFSHGVDVVVDYLWGESAKT